MLNISDFIGHEIKNELASKSITINGNPFRVQLVAITTPAMKRVEYTVYCGAGFSTVYKAEEFAKAINEYNETVSR